MRQRHRRELLTGITDHFQAGNLKIGIRLPLGFLLFVVGEICLFGRGAVQDMAIHCDLVPCVNGVYFAAQFPHRAIFAENIEASRFYAFLQTTGDGVGFAHVSLSLNHDRAKAQQQ